MFRVNGDAMPRFKGPCAGINRDPTRLCQHPEPPGAGRGPTRRDWLVVLTVSVVLNQTALSVTWHLVSTQALLSRMDIPCRWL